MVKRLGFGNTEFRQDLDAPQDHFLSQMYLKGFTDKQKTLWVYQRGQSPRQSVPKREARLKNYEVGDGHRREIEQLETRVEPILQGVRNRQPQLEKEQRDKLYDFVALTIFRVPFQREVTERILEPPMKSLLHWWTEFATDHLNLNVSKNSNPLKLTPSSHTEIMLEKARKVSKILRKEFNHALIYAPADTSFVISDNPVVTFRNNKNRTATLGVELTEKDVELLIPLSKGVCLILKRRNLEYPREADEEKVRQINEMQMRYANNCLYASVCDQDIARLFDATPSAILRVPPNIEPRTNNSH